MKNILLFGAGKSATVLIRFLLQQCAKHNWRLSVVDADLSLAAAKTGGHPNGAAFSFDVHDAGQRMAHVADADIVISLLPPSLHLLVAKDCLAAGKSLLTASYIDPGIAALQQEIEAAGLLFLCEMGLDPGIDHMSAKKLLDEIKGKGGKVLSFVSHCGGLVAPDSDDNPWHYKISWNPRNVVLAGKDGAVFRQDGARIQWPYEELFAKRRPVVVNGTQYAWYPNRDSLQYLSTYQLDDCPTFIRTTLRHPDFVYGWKHLIELGLTQQTPAYQTDGLSLRDFFRQHLSHVDFETWLEEKLSRNLAAQAAVFDKMQPGGNGIADERTAASEKLQELLKDGGLLLDQLSWLGVKDGATTIDRGLCGPAEVLQFILEEKLPLHSGDRDLVVMQHEIAYELNGVVHKLTSALELAGKDDTCTAMAATVGLPLGIAAVLVLTGAITLTGLHIPVLPEIYEPVLQLLQAEGIIFRETIE